MTHLIARGCTRVLPLVTVAFVCAAPAFADEATQVSASDASAPSAISTSATLIGYYPALHALCIGINDYADSAIPDLEYAENDARDVAKLLRDNFGFTDVATLLGNAATREGIAQAVGDLFDQSRVATDDAVLIYYSGHGQTVDLPRGGEMGFLIPQDAKIDLSRADNPAPYYRTCLPMDEVKRWRALIPARHVLIIADSCYSGLLASDRSIPRQIGDALSLGVCQILTAGTRGQKARELPEEGHGAYTAKMLEALRTGAADMNKDGYVRASELGQYLKDCLLDGQSPQSKVMDGEGDFILWPRGAGVFRSGGSALDDLARRADDVARVKKQAEDAFAKAEKIDQSGLPGAEKVKAWEVAMTACVPAAFRIQEIRARIERLKKNAEQVNYTEAAGGADLAMIWIPGGTFMMGSPQSESGHQQDEGPQHEVTLDGFWLGKYEVTVGQFRAFVKEAAFKTDAERTGTSTVVKSDGIGWPKSGANWHNPCFPGYTQSETDPVVHVSWNDAHAFCEWLSSASGHKGYDLPTEAQWEYACRAGTQTTYAWGNSPGGGNGWCNAADVTLKKKFAKLPSFDWNDGYVYTAPVGQFTGNAFGLYDMHGNVWEWCRDFYDSKYYEKSPARNPENVEPAKERVQRGGSMVFGPIGVRSAVRSHDKPTFTIDGQGFRVCRVMVAR